MTVFMPTPLLETLRLKQRAAVGSDVNKDLGASPDLTFKAKLKDFLLAESNTQTFPVTTL